jgi:hypothetical protein
MWKGDGHQDDYRIIGKVHKIERLTVLDEPAVITTIGCMPINKIDVFCLERKMDKIPKVGEMVGATGWLQGRYPHEVWKMLGT